MSNSDEIIVVAELPLEIVLRWGEDLVAYTGFDSDNVGSLIDRWRTTLSFSFALERIWCLRRCLATSLLIVFTCFSYLDYENATLKSRASSISISMRLNCVKWMPSIWAMRLLMDSAPYSERYLYASVRATAVILYEFWSASVFFRNLKPALKRLWLRHH